MTEKEKIQKKIFLRGLDNLWGVGGFIGEEIENEIYEVFPDDVISGTEKYCPMGKGFLNVAEAVDAAYKEMGKYRDYEYEDDIEFVEEFDEEFENWILDQVARLVADRYKHQTKNFWADWKLSRETRHKLMNLNALDERVLCLLSGIENGEKMNAKQISEIPEFACCERYIEKIISVIDESISIRDWGIDEFSQVCDAHISK